MTKTFTQAAAFALAVLLTAGTFAGANAMAGHEYAKADAVAAAQGQVMALQSVVVVGHRV
jgi:hypothetical protein